MIKLKEDEGSPNVLFYINNQSYERQTSIKYIFDINIHQFSFLKPGNEIIYKFYIDSICFDDLMLNNKKQKESINPTPKPNIVNQTMKINKNNLINNLNNLIQKKPDNFSRTGSDIYISNNPGKDGEKNEEKEKNYFNQGGFKLIQDGLKEGLILESVNPFQKYGDIFKENGKESVIESEDDIPEYDYLNQKIINANL